MKNNDINVRLPKNFTSLNSSIPTIGNDTYANMYHGKGTNSITKTNRKDLQIDEISNTAIAKVNGMELKFINWDKLKGLLGINAHKLLSVAIIYFTKNNNIDNFKNNSVSYKVSFSLYEFAYNKGYKIVEEPKETPELREKEKKRVANTMKQVRKDIKKDLNRLRNTQITFTEKVKGQPEDFSNLSLIGTHGIRNNRIYITLDPAFGDYLLQLPITKYSMPLLAIDGKNSNAYNIGDNMIKHFAKHNNQALGTNDRLKVSTLLSYSTFSSYDDVLSINQSWTNRIKEPFEKALDHLVEKNVLKNWYYGKAKGEIISDEEMISFIENVTYDEWIELRVYFSPTDATLLNKN